MSLRTKTELIKNNEYKKLNIFVTIKNTNRNYTVSYYDNEVYANLSINGNVIEKYKGSLDFYSNDNIIIFNYDYIIKNKNEIDNFKVDVDFNVISLDKKLTETNISDIISL